MALNPKDFIPDMYNIRESIRHIATGINKGDARNKEVAHFKTLLKENRSDLKGLGEKLKSQTWYHVEGYVSAVLEKMRTGGEDGPQIEIDWVLWATKEMNKDYYFGDLYMVEGQFVRVYEAIKGTLNKVVATLGTGSPRTKFHEVLLKSGFTQEFVDIYLFTTDWRNDVVHYQSIASAGTVSKFNTIKHIFSDVEVSINTRINSSHFGIIKLCNLIFDRLMKYLNVPEKEFFEYYAEMEKKRFPDNPGR